MTDTGALNLNLLVPLHALLQHRSVTEAARSLHLGQPAVSTALAKLRRHYGDELLVRVGNSYERTPLAESLVDVVGMAVSLTNQALAARESNLDLASMHRTFTIGLSEFELTLLGGAILRRVRAEAPNARIVFDANRAEHTRDLAGRLRQVDCMIVPQEWTTDRFHQTLLSDQLCLLVSAANTTVPAVLDRAGLAALRFVFGPGASVVNLVNGTLLRTPIRVDQIVASTDSLIGQVAAVVGSDLAAILPRRLVPALARPDQLRIVEAPDLAERFTLCLAWHPARDRDAGIAWLRHLVAAAAREVEASDRRPTEGERPVPASP